MSSSEVCRADAWTLWVQRHWAKVIHNRLPRESGCPSLTRGPLKALGSEDLAPISCCGHSDTLLSRKINSTWELFGLHPDFPEGHAHGPMGFARLWRQPLALSFTGWRQRGSKCLILTASTSSLFIRVLLVLPHAIVKRKRETICESTVSYKYTL